MEVLDDFKERPATGGGASGDDYMPATPLSRFIAVFVDFLFMAVLVRFLPYIGALISIVYLLSRDCLPFMDGQSLGKKVMNIRVVMETNGSPITNNYETGIVRNIPFVIPIFNIIDALMLLNVDRKRIGDRWAKTVVIKESFE